MDVREKLVEIIQNSVGGCARHWAEVIADGLIEHGVTVQEWISVKDRLPENEKPVLTFIGYEESMIGFIVLSSYFCFEPKPHWQWDELLKDEQKTLFWMPLPHPPKEEARAITSVLRRK